MMRLECRNLFSVFQVPIGSVATAFDAFRLSLYTDGPILVAVGENNSSQSPLVPPAASTIQIDGTAGNESFTLDFTKGAFSLTPNNPLIQITGSNSSLLDTLTIRDTNGNDSVSQFPSGDPNYPTAILFTDFDTNSSTTIEYSGGITNIVIDTPEPSTLTLFAATGLVLASYRGRTPKER